MKQSVEQRGNRGKHINEAKRKMDKHGNSREGIGICMCCEREYCYESAEQRGNKDENIL
jgi:hypothetical protein